MYHRLMDRLNRKFRELDHSISTVSTITHDCVVFIKGSYLVNDDINTIKEEKIKALNDLKGKIDTIINELKQAKPKEKEPVKLTPIKVPETKKVEEVKTLPPLPVKKQPKKVIKVEKEPPKVVNKIIKRRR